MCGLSYRFCSLTPQTDDAVKAVGSCSYNQLVEKIIFCKQSDDSQLVSEGGCGHCLSSPLPSPLSVVDILVPMCDNFHVT